MNQKFYLLFAFTSWALVVPTVQDQADEEVMTICYDSSFEGKVLKCSRFD
jgi:hypothetical protein